MKHLPEEEKRGMLSEKLVLRETIVHLAVEVLSQSELFTSNEQEVARRTLEALRGGQIKALERIMNVDRPHYWRVIADFLIIRQMVEEVVLCKLKERKAGKGRRKRKSSLVDGGRHTPLADLARDYEF
ncbi:MAG: hypothetical protein UV80_C0007G0034 [Candidatus Peregrinibacteria bacterium GW2011_GWF2_43_17]|nr:MAG: hypothetical protein UV80_C0007G0034 [Candidatus Peregrinibacteria bacterium GW2011_GWF2_43_17]KKT18676.1 MAG: hypothetical protein UW03_C0034G0005 [Candidatus Peregrinibacteria bacterium GW2011_GWA2_43_8]HAU39576.1 hypothetical protein [Candidatus Peregrinibacteria bacterium]